MFDIMSEGLYFGKNGTKPKEHITYASEYIYIKPYDIITHLCLHLSGGLIKRDGLPG